ncbi:formimidoylglutamate deiminase [Bosea sp. (in: a-proteobacteria)]|uniref:formimidoylglutamate deiminase n=1 Tax=Bosea sp. (in: a-proteobacteria) TaxID=1871050 RepID=UPI00261097C2|nr:formimidoylglutamate deiminase [Bosea sp. (in: a-proteobacteria)]MCO5089407.1 formimidoylglutamate deiminase [Bosea sp. (in: a-proteobacteria)]
MSETLHLAEALLPGGFARDVALTVSEGVIVSVETGVKPAAEARRFSGLALPGMPNLHSHAFQRGMAGLSERRGAPEDSFWTWREVMYRFLDRLDPEDVQAIAAQAFVEMLEGGFTALAEFHYLHHDKDGRAYANIATMGQAIAAAAQETGLGLTLLPVLYRFGNFGEAPSVHGQRRFVNARDAYQRLLEGSAAAIRDLPDARLGVAPHSLRAVALDDLGWVSSLRPDDPVHIHVAEQVPEVEASLKITGKRPVELLMDTVALDRRWCLIHATHLTDAERDGIALSGAVAGLCPITESSLGDGIFDGIRYVQAGGAYGVGSDSNIQIDAGAELRQLEYSQRLRDRRRALFAQEDASTGLALWRAAAAGGARACGRAIGALAPGHRADFVTLDADHPALVGRSGAEALDSAIFAANALPLREVVVGGRRVVAEGRHVARDSVRRRFAGVMRRLLAAA